MVTLATLCSPASWRSNKTWTEYPFYLEWGVRAVVGAPSVHHVPWSLVQLPRVTQCACAESVVPWGRAGSVPRSGVLRMNFNFLAGGTWPPPGAVAMQKAHGKGGGTGYFGPLVNFYHWTQGLGSDAYLKCGKVAIFRVWMIALDQSYFVLGTVLFRLL